MKQHNQTVRLLFDFSETPDLIYSYAELKIVDYLTGKLL